MTTQGRLALAKAMTTWKQANDKWQKARALYFQECYTRGLGTDTRYQLALSHWGEAYNEWIEKTT